jgi:hypothetical protein
VNRPTEQEIREQYDRAVREVLQLKGAGADAPYDEGIADALAWVLGENESLYQVDSGAGT